MEKKNGNESHIRSREIHKCTLVSVIINSLLTAFQILAGIFSGSQGLIADGIHSLSDLSSDFVVLVANKKSQKASGSAVILVKAMVSFGQMFGDAANLLI